MTRATADGDAKGGTRGLIKTVSLILGTAVVAVVATLSVTPTSGAGPAIHRTPDGKPDFSGVWMANNEANWDLLTHDSRPMVAQDGVYPNDPIPAAPVITLGTVAWIPPGLGVVEGNEIPYQPWAAARKKENLENWLDRDPELKCFLPGVPRAMYLPYPYQIVQSPTKIFMAFEFADASRTIHLDDVAPYPNIAYMGHSLGRWEGDTLVVNTSEFTDQTWFDRSGNFHSDALKLVERFTLRTRDVIHYEATIDDPGVFTRPWKISMPLYRRMEKDARLMEFKCVEKTEETRLGYLRRVPLVKRWEGLTTIVDVTRKSLPPSMSYEEGHHTSGNPPAKQ
jgi:hypothetical protein